MNDHENEALRMYTDRCEKRLRECALRIQEHIGYVLDRIDRGEPTSTDHYLNGISMDAQEARILVGVLDGIKTGASFTAEPVTVKEA